MVFSGDRRFFLAVAAARQARGPSVHDDACLDPSRAPWRCSQLSASLNWLFSVKGLCPASLKGAGACKNALFFFTSPRPSHILFSFRSPARCTTYPVQLPYLLSATQQHSLAIATDGACVCMICVCASKRGVRGAIGTPSNHGGGRFFFVMQPLILAATKSVYGSTAAAI